ncbi:LacI family DNA-binding transcriptional regulator [Reinekea blandensis]|uniref:Transcriptional regulator n=1 Tax=Reinekea blandensis MED297 TaxID=314283 RepID=A4BK32_9GAMM|nr:LacI family DNA-binding transcriptional regulator [Reinekea blandensis]EAR07514.1 Transcriptional regulator [Reinekea sp. MED297] [Reinekea blandensis MED297]
MTGTKKHTVKSIAQMLNVSTATVSNAFNRPDQLSRELRQRILAECERLGYSGPNPAARSLRTGATGVVGVMLADKLAYNFTDSCALEFLQGVSQVLDDAQVNMLLMPGRREFYREKSLEAIPERYILYGPPRDMGILERIERQRKPIVSVDFSLPNHLALNVDNYGGAKAAAQHIFATTDGPVYVMGLRLTKTPMMKRIDEEELRSPDLSISRQRLEAYLDAGREAGRPIRTEHIWSSNESTWYEGIQAAREALNSVPRPAALLCMSDQLALAALSVARELEIDVPGQLKIVGFDDTPEARRNHPQISTVYQPSVEKGRLAAMMVLNPERYESRVLPTTLHIRETS